MSLIQAKSILVFLKEKRSCCYKGAGINMKRGVEELIQSMQYLDDSFFLLIIGSGTNWNVLKGTNTRA
jgi:hypothetical protein